MAEVAGEHVVEVAFVETVHAEGEVVHEGKHVVRRPDQIQAIEQSVDARNCIPDITLGEAVKQLLELPVDLLVEHALGGHPIEYTLGHRVQQADAGELPSHNGFLNSLTHHVHLGLLLGLSLQHARCHGRPKHFIN